MTNAVANTNGTQVAAAIEEAMVRGNLKDLSPAQRVDHYKRVCDSLGLNPWTRPFQYIEFQGALQLYARREASDQLAALHKVNRSIIEQRLEEGLYLVTVRATTPDGRSEESTGAVSIEGLKGEARANALMKGETKAKRRATLSIVGLGWLDETEVATIKGARYVEVDHNTGEITGSRSVEQLPEPQARANPDDLYPPVDDRRADWRRFWVKAADLGYYKPNPNTGKRDPDKRRVHEALSLDLRDGALAKAIAEGRYTYASALAVLEQMADEAQPDPNADYDWPETEPDPTPYVPDGAQPSMLGDAPAGDPVDQRKAARR